MIKGKVDIVQDTLLLIKLHGVIHYRCLGIYCPASGRKLSKPILKEAVLKEFHNIR